MPTLSVKEIENGTMISFRSKDPNNTVLWRGILESSSGTLKSIRHLDNPAPSNEAVRQADPTVPSDLSLLSYFIITLDNDADPSSMRVFAQEWIEPGSLSVINLGNKITIVVDDPTNNPQQILSILANAGYRTKLVT